MRDYATILKRLRRYSENCVAYKLDADFANAVTDAADAIEELLAAADSVVKCKDCEWWTKQEASIQGRCARFAIYPTGEFYCASGSKEEPPKGVE